MAGETYSLDNDTYTCTGNYQTGQTSCANLYVGAGGNTYQLTDAPYFGDPINGYYVDVTFFHPTYGSVEISTASPITFNCDNGAPSSGTISFVGTGGSSGSITFNDCTSYTISYDDGEGNTGTIEGTW